MSALSRRNTRRDAAELAYRCVVEQARRPVFFVACGVPDTLDGRFELVCLHAFLYLWRLKAEGPRAKGLGQALFDMMFADLDAALRELGTGDLSVGREVKRMAKGFYGRVRAYEEGIAADDSVLGAALRRNLFGTVAAPAPELERMTHYIRHAVEELRRQEAAALLAGRVRFPTPEACAPAAGGAGR